MNGEEGGKRIRRRDRIEKGPVGSKAAAKGNRGDSC